jgi:predicted RecA/RadA family phage recombinase
MATRATLTPESVLAFDATTSETAYWTLIAPQGLSGTQSLIISYAMASATTGGVAFDVAVEAISSGDATDTDATTSFATVNAATDAAVPGTAGYMEQVTVTLTNDDSMAAGDLVRISIARDVADAADTATGDLYLLAAEWRDSA